MYYPIQCRNTRYYHYNQTLPYDEDISHEFKGHRNIVVGEVPPISYKHGSRQHISKYVLVSVCTLLVNGFVHILTFILLWHVIYNNSQFVVDCSVTNYLLVIDFNVFNSN